MNKPKGFNLIKIGELALELGVPTQTLRNWANDGTIPVRQRSVRGTRWFSLEDVKRSLNLESPGIAS